MIGLQRLAWPSSVPSGAGVFAGAVLAKAVSVTVGTVEGSGEIVWLPAGGLLAVLMRVPENRWLACCAAAWLGVLAAQLLVQQPLAALEIRARIFVLAVGR